MPLSPDHKETLRKSTKAAAAAFLEDIQHIRELIEKPDQARGEVRRASAILRRLLVEDDLAAIAAPRIGRIMLRAPDNNPAYRYISPETCDLFVSGGTRIFGLETRAVTSAAGNGFNMKGFDPDRVSDLRINNFLTQRVLYWSGTWAARGAIIKYVANIAQGVHSGAPQTAMEKNLAEARHRVVLGRRGKDGIGIAFNSPQSKYDESKLEFSDDAIDLLLIEMFAAARYLCESPDVLALEAVVRKEKATEGLA